MAYVVASQLIGNQTKRVASLTLQESSKESRGIGVQMGLDESVDHIAVLIDRPPKILTLPQIK